MEKRYRKEKNNIVLINYWVAFCPLYKRKIFKDKEVIELLIEIIKNVSEDLDVILFNIEFKDDYCVVLHINCPADIAIHDFLAKIKTQSSKSIRDLIKTTRKAIWTRNYLVTTEENLNYKILDEFLSMQKNYP